MELIEQLFGSGNVSNGNEFLGTIYYRLFVYQEIVEGEEGLKNITGKIDAEKAMIFFGQSDLRLKSEDGRNIKFFVRNSEGDIQCSGGFYE